jgi:tetratricopeptide (TPR) repeat protein
MLQHAPLFAVPVLLCSVAALASPAEDAFRAGDFAKAVSLARELGTADGDALAARATLAIAAYQSRDRASAETLLDQALADAKRARAKAPGHIEGLLQNAIALGYRAKLRQSPGIAKEAKALMEEARKRAPNNGFALAALAGWNGEAVADLGSLIARTVLGARKDESLRYYEAALKADPQSPTIATFYAFTLLRLDAKAYGARAGQLLTRAVALPPRDGFEALLIGQARSVLEAQQANKPRDVARLLGRYQPFGLILAK